MTEKKISSYKYYGHTKPGEPESEWQQLKEHLSNVAKISSNFSREFNSKDIGYVIGLLHDVGKYSEAFQSKLFDKKIKTDHSTAGAQLAMVRYGKMLGRVIAYSICGHHGGMPDDVDSGRGYASLEERLKKQIESYDEFFMENELQDKISLPCLNETSHMGFSIAFYIRMLFSCLVDADFLDTEKFYNLEMSEKRKQWPSLHDIECNFAKYMQRKRFETASNPMYSIRNEIFQACIIAAEKDKGLFILEVPTGGGKTLSSLAFALEHAKYHAELKRIIYAIPFTSIIEQNAEVFRGAVGENAVLEHHSNLNYNKDIKSDEDNINRLASENWDAPLVITTNVQLFESLFSNKPSRCRKLHNLSNSVIILDEAQTLPDELLLPCLAALQQLCSNYGATVVFCTATQPAIERILPDPVNLTRIIPNSKELFQQLRRTTIINLGDISDLDLIKEFSKHKQALCIVNTRKHARKLYDLMQDDNNVIHLSALMCPQHRTEVIKNIRIRLKENQSCKVISTQLIEAGVDVDFPVVYRASAGIDSIAQAAGRCNREKHKQNANVFIFFPEGGLPKGWFQRMAAIGNEVLKRFDDPLSPEAIEHFFSLRYGMGAVLDKYEILSALDAGANTASFSFAEIADEFQFIESQGKNIIIPYDDNCKTLLQKAESSKYPAYLLRGLQRYSVTVYPNEFKQLENRGYLKNIGDVLTVLNVNDYDFQNVYSPKIGLCVEPEMEVLTV